MTTTEKILVLSLAKIVYLERLHIFDVSDPLKYDFWEWEFENIPSEIYIAYRPIKQRIKLLEQAIAYYDKLK